MFFCFIQHQDSWKSGVIKGNVLTVGKQSDKRSLGIKNRKMRKQREREEGRKHSHIQSRRLGLGRVNWSRKHC